MKFLTSHLGRFLVPTILWSCAVWTGTLPPAHAADDPWLVFQGTAGAGHGKHIVLVSGDEEYRSEEALPQLAKILSQHHGFKCTVLFAIDPATGEINPNEVHNLPGLEALRTADLLIIFTRHRDLPDDQMQEIVDYLRTRKPVIGLRTATHAFLTGPGAKFAQYGSQSKTTGFEQGFGRQILGETWVAHHGAHAKESTRGLIAAGQEQHPILRGIHDGDIWCPTDVYKVRLPLPAPCQPLVLGQVLSGMTPDAAPVEGAKNDPLMPVAWVKTAPLSKAGTDPANSTNSNLVTDAESKPARVFATTMGAAQDLQNEALRRLLVNACYWCLGMEEKMPERAVVDLVGEYHPSAFAFDGFRKGVKPADLR